MAKSAKAKKANATATPAKKGGKKASGGKGRFSRAQAGKASKSGKSGKASQKAKGGSRTVQFLREVKVEMSKVTWPTRDELVQSTIAVMVAVVITGVFIFILDIIFSRLIRLVS